MLSKKLRITSGTHIVAFHAPADYAQRLGAFPDNVNISQELNGKHAFIHWFVKDQAALERDLSKVMKALQPGGMLWISYPKISSGMQTDLNRDKGWDSLMALNLEWKSMISFDEEWSAFLLLNQPPKGQSKASADYHSNQAEYIDAKNKTIHIPNDLQQALDAAPDAYAFYQTLSFTNRKEYVMWVVGAKRAETRTDRIQKSITKLLEGRRNPSAK